MFNKKGEVISQSATFCTIFSSAKKGIGPVVATALFLVVAVVSVISFQGWFQTFSSGLFTDVEEKGSISSLNLGIDALIGSALYVKAGDGLNITAVRINGEDCGISGIYYNMSSIDVSSCLSQVSSNTAEVVLMTDRGVSSKYFNLGSSSLSNFVSECYNPVNVGTIGNWSGCDGMLIVDRDMLINAEWFLPTKHDRYIAHNGINFTFGDSAYNVFTGQVTDMSGDINNLDWCSLIFSDFDFCLDDWNNEIGFNADIGYWDVSNVQNMSFLFADAINFNQSLNNWDVSNVVDMSGMFWGPSNFNQPLNSWDVSNVQDMYSMFFASSFDQPLYNWDVKNVVDMEWMFFFAENFSQDLSSWCTQIFNEPSGFSAGTQIDGIPSLNPSWSEPCNLDLDFIYDDTNFYESDNTIYCENAITNSFGEVNGVTYFATSPEYLKIIANKGIYFSDGIDTILINSSNVCTSKIVDMSNLFRMNNIFNSDISNWDVSNVVDMSGMFFSSSFNQPLNNWNVSRVIDMSEIFTSSTFNQPLDNWDVSQVINMSYMFGGGRFGVSSFNQDINNWDVSQVIDMSGMFAESPFNQPLDNWNVSNVLYMDEMFYEGNPPSGVTSFNQDISNWCVDNILTEPSNFASGSPLDSTPSFKPVWGSCP